MVTKNGIVKHYTPILLGAQVFFRKQFDYHLKRLLFTPCLFQASPVTRKNYIQTATRRGKKEAASLGGLPAFLGVELFQSKQEQLIGESNPCFRRERAAS
ncbi:MAG: hypothetical protein J1E01_09595, partial [Acetatifactor sp.]|nr:hypothetical protein [Acetatifactor sp.]